MSAVPKAEGPGLAFNPLAPEFIRDPYPVYRQLRLQSPLLRTPIGFLASRHADIAFVLRDRRFGKRFRERMSARYGVEALNGPALRGLELMMLTRDPPDHTRLRGLVVKAFTAKRVDEMRPRIQAIVDSLLDRVIPQGGMDVIRDFAHALPVIVICDMLGIPEADRRRFLDGSRINGRLLDPVPMSAAELATANANAAESAAYFNELFEFRRRHPGDDLTTHLVQAEEAGERLSNEELHANIQLLFAAGHETTTNTIGNGLLALHRHPDQWQALRDDPDLVPNAVEELLRYDSAVQMTSRTALEDLPLGDIVVPAGEAVITLLGAGNRDPEVHQEPDRLDVRRLEPRPLSFGGGIHFCLGAQLSRIESDVAFRTLLRRLPNLQLPEREQPTWRQSFTLRGLERLPAVW